MKPTNQQPTESPDEIIWKLTNGAVPLHVVQVIPIDKRGRILMMRRGPTVRSAPNCWSFPSGMHEIGESCHHTAVRELLEEYGLPIIGNTVSLGCYENIAGDNPGSEQYHWVITLLGGLVQDVEEAENKEPEKHPEMVFVDVGTLMMNDFLKVYPFHASFNAFFRMNALAVTIGLQQLAEGVTQ